MPKPRFQRKALYLCECDFCARNMYDLQVDEGGHKGEEGERAQVVGGHVGGGVESRAGGAGAGA